MDFEVINHMLCAVGMPAKSMQGALENSIKKWKFIVESLKSGEDIAEDGGASSCNLCYLYNREHRLATCEGCPVITYGGGGPFCMTTPYDRFIRSNSLQGRLKAAIDELAFLHKIKEKLESEALVSEGRCAGDCGGEQA